MAVELHCHTTASDGTLTPEELVALALRRGLQTLAITDHDTTSGFAPAVAAAAGYRLEIIPAIEINAEDRGRDVHVLGYYLDPEHSGFQEALGRLRQARLRRTHEMVERLESLGVPVEHDRIMRFAGGDSAGRPHVARAMVEAGHVRDLQDAFDRYLATGRPGFVPRRNLTPAEAIGLIREAGGVAVLAHPGLIGDESVIRELIPAGLQGLEVHYPQHPPMLRQHYTALAGELGLLVTGGSDFHGPEHRHNVELGGMALPPGTVERLRRTSGRGRQS